MKIAILGTRGIPNNYGGFEQCAEKLSVRWVKEGHEVTVYNPDEHPYREKDWKGVRIKQIPSKESRLGIWGIFIYDYLCLHDAVKQDYDIILNLGYVPIALFFKLKKRSHAKFITNMDGLEWKRSKWNSILKKFIRFCERRAVNLSDALISDNPGIRDYLLREYKKDSYYIPYGAELFYSPVEDYLIRYELEKYNYFMLIARLEPENNIEIILDGYLLSGSKYPFVVIGNFTKYGKFLLKKYKRYSNIKFLGPIYNYNILSSLRLYSKLYFHGHSVGGTNPSLLEAMASNAYIVAHYNPFNRYILGDDAFYFSNDKDIYNIIINYTDKYRTSFICNNRKKFLEIYNWKKVANQYLNIFKDVLIC